MSPTWCPARPVRCRPLATDGGDSTWMTRSTEPMSMPSSRLDVATTAGSRPAFSASSIWVRSCRDTEPWCARATSAGAPADAPDSAMISAGVRAGTRPGPCPLRSSARSAASSLSRAQRRSARRREFAKTIVERWASISSSTRSSTCGQIERRRAGSSGPWPSAGAPSAISRSAMSSTGTTICSSIRLSLRGCTTVTGRLPPRNVATSAGGRTVADSPIRCARRLVGSPRSASRRSSERAR